LLASEPPDSWKIIRESLSIRQARALLYDWPFWARDSQLAPNGNWQTWLFLGGRGAGKSRAGGEWVRSIIEQGQARRIALVAPTAADARDVMVEGESGILAIAPPWLRPLYEPSKRRLTWKNGARATLFSADEPERLRGPQFDSAWCDELVAWRFPEAWDLLQFGLRKGSDPRCVVTTTPKPIKILTDLIERSTTAITRSTTYENRANLAPAFFDRIVSQYEGTRLGRQEINAEILDDVEGALWTRDQIEDARVMRAPELTRIVVSVDPSATSGGNECGITVQGIALIPNREGSADAHGYLLDDLSMQGAPHAWAREAVTAYHKWKADRLVAETNQGGEMVRQTIASIDPSVSYRGVHASRGKLTRAEPISSFYEQQRIHHVGCFPELEDEMCSWQAGGESPNRLDAMVHGFTDLMISKRVIKFGVL
jgi:phage terminase large subunit-like protein